MRFNFTEKGYVFNSKGVIYESFVSFFDTKDFLNSFFNLLRMVLESEDKAKALWDNVLCIVQKYDKREIITRAEFARRINHALVKGGL